MRASLLLLLALARALELPLFPLRKAPRCPTDRLSLNLFEPRYVALAERVLASDGVFAGLHCEGPHVLPRGRGPATPLVAEGGVGSVFAVDDWERDGSVVRIAARAFGRFAVRRVVATPANRGDVAYVVVDAAPVTDVRPSPALAEAEARALRAVGSDVGDVRRYAAELLVDAPEGYAAFAPDESELLSFVVAAAAGVDKRTALEDTDTVRRLERALR